jgi:hypothetical protein
LRVGQPPFAFGTVNEQADANGGCVHLLEICRPKRVASSVGVENRDQSISRIDPKPLPGSDQLRHVAVGKPIAHRHVREGRALDQNCVGGVE